MNDSRERPLLRGLVAGAFLSLLVALLVGWAPRWNVVWPLMMLALCGQRRAPLWQAAALLPMVTAQSFLQHVPPMGMAIGGAAAIGMMLLLRPPEDQVSGVPERMVAGFSSISIGVVAIAIHSGANGLLERLILSNILFLACLVLAETAKVFVQAMRGNPAEVCIGAASPLESLRR